MAGRRHDEIKMGRFPKLPWLGRASAWPESEIRAWIEARKAERTAA
jgi:predicted DNA-binding transcriptional regulator AlpA